jgi:guanylate kinase
MVADKLAPLVVVSGPSGVGKSTIVRAVLDRDPEIWLSVSVTTRSPRLGEVNGVDYHFVSDTEFEKLIETGGLLEWATYAGKRYGTPAEPVHRMRSQGRPVLLEIEVQGARAVRARAEDAYLVFITPPDIETLRLRLSGRGTEDPDGLAERMSIANSELEAAIEFDRVLVNSHVGECSGDLLELISELKRVT